MSFNTSNILSSFLKKSGMWTAAKIIQALIIFFIFYIYAFFLSKSDYGNYQKVFVLIGFLSGLLSFGLNTYIPALPLEEMNGVFRSIFKRAGWLILIAAIVFIVIVYNILPNLSIVEKSMAILLGILNALNLIYELYALKQSRDRFVLNVNILISIFYLLVHLTVLFSYKLSVLLFLLIFVALVRLVLFYIRFNAIGENVVRPNTAPTKKYYYQWIYVAINEALELLSRHIDKIVLIGLLAAADFAVYFNGSYEIPVLGLLVGVAGTFTNLQTIQHKLRNYEIKNVFYIITLLLATFVFPLFFFARLYAFPLFAWLFKNKYNDAVPFFLIYAWIIPLRINNYTAILQEKMKSHLVVTGSVSALILKLLLMITFYQVYGVIGIAIACVVGTFYQVIFYLFHIAKSLAIPITEVLPFKKLSVIFLFSLVFNAGFYLYLRNLPFSIQIIGGCTIAGLNAFVVLWFYVRNQINVFTFKT